MAHPDMQLVSRIIRHGVLDEVMQWGIVAEDFTNLEARSIFTHLRGVFLSPDTRGSVLGIHAATQYYPAFVYCDDDGVTTEALCLHVRLGRVGREMGAALLHADELLTVNPQEAVNYIVSVGNQLQQLTTSTKDTHFSDAMDDLVQRYELTEQGIMVGAARWPWEPVQKETGGIQNDDYIVLYGRPKSMKSFVLAAMAADFYDQGLKVLVYTKEMPAWQLFRRISACQLRLPYNELRLAKLPPAERKWFMDFREEVHEERERTHGRHDLIVISGKDAAGGDNIRWVQSKVVKHKPDVVIIDGLYLLAGINKVKSDEERVRSISRDARQMVLDTGIPLIATMQATRAAAKHSDANLNEIAYSDALAQDATAAIRCINEKTGPYVSLVFGGSREYHLHGLRIWAVPCTNFTYKEALTEKAVNQIKDADVDEEAAAAPESTVQAKPRRISAGVDPAKAAAAEQRIRERAAAHAAK